MKTDSCQWLMRPLHNILRHMDSKKYAKELLELMKSQKRNQEALDCSDDADIEIIVVDPKPSPASKAKSDAMDFWVSRARHKSKQSCIDLDPIPPPSTTSALLAPRIHPPPARALIPIVTHERERARGEKQVINVEQASAKMNAEKYRNKLFKIEEKKPAQKSCKEIQQLAKLRMERQERELADGDKPRWKQEKEKREEINRCKYPITSIGTYGFDHHPGTRGLDTFSQARWQQFQRKQQISRQKFKEKKEEERRKERDRQKQLKKQKIMDQTALFQQFADGMFGSKKQKNEVSDIALQQNEPGMEASRFRDTMQQDSVLSAEQGEAVEPRMPRYGLKDIIMVSQSPYSSEIIRAVLAHDFSRGVASGQAKKIPDVFDDGNSYKRVFHFLIANESIADVQQRMQKIEKEDSSVQPIKVSISTVKSNSEGQTEIYMKQVQPKTEKGFLRGYSLSRLRIGLLTNHKAFKREMYGWSQSCEKFAILVVLATPQTKEEMEQVKALGRFKVNDMEMLLRKNRREAYFYDLDKLSTNYREYQAVTHMPFSDLAPVILDPRLMEREMGAYVSRKQLLNDILKGLQLIFNQTQCESIREMVLRQKGIVMLQGPPGTGKTSTLMGLLSAQFEYLKRSGDNRKIMICAPSNAAVDHIVKRLLTEGIFNGEGEIFFPNALRVGIVESSDETVQSVSLDNLCEKKMIQQQKKASESGRLSTIEAKEKLIATQTKLRHLNRPGCEKEYNQLKMEELKYHQMLFAFKAEKVVISRKQYRYFQSQYLAAADIILTTLSSAGNEKLEQLRGEIACLIIDEAAQATEPNLLIALQTGVQKVLLIGDPYQLPATCMSADCNVTLFNRSLFQRFLDAGNKPYFLNIQYRMAPMIRSFPSRRFYQNRLIDAASVAERAIPPFLECFNGRSVAFVDIKYSKEEARSNSFYNEAEARAVGMLVKCLSAPDVSMGIITPYQAQRSVIMREARNELKRWPEDLPHFEKNVMINTVDSFQGQEKDIIIVSTVRANSKLSLGFLTDQRRINVTLTRSKYLMIIVGNGHTLGSNEVWNDFLEWAERERIYYEVPSPEELQQTLKNMFTFANSKPITRRRHTHLSKDIRRQKREQLDSSEIKSKKAQDKLASKAQKEKSNTDMSPSHHSPVLPPSPPQALPNKYALDIKQSQKIRDQKRQKEKEAQQFQALHSRMRIEQQQVKKDKFYGDLFK